MRSGGAKNNVPRLAQPCDPDEVTRIKHQYQRVCLIPALEDKVSDANVREAEIEDRSMRRLQRFAIVDRSLYSTFQRKRIGDIPLYIAVFSLYLPFYITWIVNSTGAKFSALMRTFASPGRTPARRIANARP